MKSVVIASVPVHGHVAPLLGVARALVARGDRVRFLTGSRFASAVAATGAVHVPLPDDADFDDRLDLAERFPGRASLSGAKAIAFDVEHVFVQPGLSQYAAVMAAHEEEPVDTVLADPAFVGGAYLVGHPRQRRPAVVVCGVLPLSLASRDVAPFGMGLSPARWLNRTRNRALAAIARPVLRSAERSASEGFRAVHGRALDHPVLDWMGRADALAQFTVEGFEYPRSDTRAALRFVGPITAPTARGPLPDWWADLDGDRPVVHVTQGTIANKDFSQLVGPVLEALADEDLVVVVATGGRPIEALPALPANARAAEFLDYERFLPHADVFVTNGGYGGVQYALRHGVPIVATGGKEDKPEVGARIAWSGVGVRIRAERPSSRKLRRAIRSVLDDPSYRAASRRIAVDVAASPGVDGLLAVVDDVCVTRAGL